MSRIAANRTNANVWRRPEEIHVVEIRSRSGSEVIVDEFVSQRQALDWAQAHQEAAGEIRLHRYTRSETTQLWPLRCVGCSWQECHGCDCECHQVPA